jgi:hypothetical protein
MARKLAIQLYWMMRKEWDYEQVNRFGPHAGQPKIVVVCSKTPSD